VQASLGWDEYLNVFYEVVRVCSSTTGSLLSSPAVSRHVNLTAVLSSAEAALTQTVTQLSTTADLYLQILPFNLTYAPYKHTYIHSETDIETHTCAHTQRDTRTHTLIHAWTLAKHRQGL
jgi:hypothetical protein